MNTLFRLFLILFVGLGSLSPTGFILTDDFDTPEKKAEKARWEKAIEEMVQHLGTWCSTASKEQAEILEATKALADTIAKRPNKKATQEDFAVGDELVKRTEALIRQTDETIAWMKKEGTAVAFPRVLEETRKDIARCSTRLQKREFGKETQYLQEDAAKAFEEMSEAVRKKR